MRLVALSTCVFFSSTWTPAVLADDEIISIGGDQGLSWESGGGTIPPTVILTQNSVDHINAPGGVIDFDSPDRPNWIFPQRADTTKNILVGLTSPARGGAITTPNPAARQALADQFTNMIDDDGETALEAKAVAGAPSHALGLLIEFDLNALFGVNRIKFFPRNADPSFPAPAFPFENDFLKGYEIFVNDGRIESQRDGRPIWSTVAIESQNEETVADIRIPTQYVRFLRLKSLRATGFEIAEFQMFGEGFVPTARYISNIFDFGEEALLGNLRWIQEQLSEPTLSRARVRTRAGSDEQPVEFTRVGVQPSGRTVRVNAEGAGALQGQGVTHDIPIEVPWKRSQDVENEELKTLIETRLDNDDIDGREALLIFRELPHEQRAEITLDEADYTKLSSSIKGELREDVTNWSPWSPPYPVPGIVTEEQLLDPSLGTQIASPSPRRYFQFMIEFTSDNFNAATGIGGLSFDASSPPLADEIIAEIFPRDAAVGETTEFTYAVLNRAGPGYSGFDHFEIDTPLRVERVGRIEITLTDGTVQAVADFSSVPLTILPVVQDDFAVEEVRDGGFVVSFPRLEGDGTLLKVEFDNVILRLGTVFTARALNPEATVLGQSVIGGNAADLGRADLEDPDDQPIGSLNPANLIVTVPISEDLLANVRAEPGVFTPNGDGINDRGSIRYDVTSIARLTPVRIEIFDLAGRLVRVLYEGSDISGRFARAWDGRDDSHALVAPGHYVFTVSLSAGTGKERKVGLIGVAY